MAGQLSAVNLIAGAGILGNVGGVPISANSSALINISTFTSLAVESQFANVKTTGNSILDSTTMTLLNNLASNTFPAVTNAVPTAYISSLGDTPLAGLTSLVSNEIANIMGNGDLGKFEQVLNTAVAYIITTNLLINSAVNANNSSQNAIYSSQDNIITGGLSQVTQAFIAFGADLTALGVAFDLENLSNLGSPQALLRQINSQSNGSSALNTALINAGIGQDILNNIDTIIMTDEQQKIVFTVMSNVTGSTLTQILKLLKVSTVGLTTLAELLDPVKAFPNSYNTLTAPTVNGLRGIYINSSGAVNTSLETQLPTSVLMPIQGYQTVQNTYSQLKKIIPSDWALANKALQAGLEQIKEIFNSTVAILGRTSLSLESNKGLNLINALTSPLPASVTNFYNQTYAAGTGVNGTFLLADAVGTAGGWVINTDLPAATNVITTLTSSGALSTLTNGSTGVYTVMANTLANAYGNVDSSITIPGGLPGAGTYANANVAFTGGLIPAAYSLIGTIVTNNSSNVSNANAAWSNIASQLAIEKTTQASAGIVFGNLQVGVTPTNLVTSLPQYGLDTTEGGAAWLMESVANVSTLGGQAIISTMREARNQALLQTAGIGTDIIIDDTTVQPQASLSSGQYTASEAASQKII